VNVTIKFNDAWTTGYAFDRSLAITRWANSKRDATFANVGQTVNTGDVIGLLRARAGLCDSIQWQYPNVGMCN
jgi:hypothetical protein